MLCNHGGTAVMMAAQNSLPITEGGAVRPPHHRLIATLSGLHAQTGVMTLLAVLLVHLWVVNASSQTAIDTARSVLTVRVYKAGMLSGFGHEHTIRARMQNGTFDEEKRTVTFVVDARDCEFLTPMFPTKTGRRFRLRWLARKFWKPSISMKFVSVLRRSAGAVTTGGPSWAI